MTSARPPAPLMAGELESLGRELDVLSRANGLEIPAALREPMLKELADFRRMIVVLRGAQGRERE